MLSDLENRENLCGRPVDDGRGWTCEFQPGISEEKGKREIRQRQWKTEIKSRIRVHAAFVSGKVLLDKKLSGTGAVFYMEVLYGNVK